MKAFKFFATALAILSLSVFTGCDDDDEVEIVGSPTYEYPNYSVGEICGLDNGEVLCLQRAWVVGVAVEGYIVSDDFSTFIYVSDHDIPALGDEVSVSGRKSTNFCGFPLIRAESHEVVTSGNDILYPKPDDISGKAFESYNGTTWSYVCVTGKLSGTTITTSYSDTRSVTVVDTPDIGLSIYEGASVVFDGFFAGFEGDEIRLIVTTIEGRKNLSTYLSDDLEWIAPYAEAAGAGDNVATGISTTNAPSVSNSSGFMSEFEERGYEFVNSTSTLAAYLQTNYLKFGATNGTAHSGIKFPVLGVTDGTDIVLQFDWCPMRGGGLYYDRVAVEVYVGDTCVERFYHSLINPDGAANDGTSPLSWITESLLIEDYSPSEQIVIRSYPWASEDSSTYPIIGGSADFYYIRYFLDNFEVSEAY